MSHNGKTGSLFPVASQTPTTAWERTDAAVKLILGDEAETRADLTASLRAARLARDMDGKAHVSPSGKSESHD